MTARQFSRFCNGIPADATRILWSDGSGIAACGSRTIHGPHDYKRRTTAQHRHDYIPALALGENPDGSARVWVCDSCGARIRYSEAYAIDPAAAHVIADIRGTGLRSTRKDAS